MSLLKRLFGGSDDKKPSAEPVEHDGFRIYAEPAATGGGYRVAARIEKDFGDQTKTHQMIRADVIASAEEARTTTLSKARQLIDQQGDTIFR